MNTPSISAVLIPEELRITHTAKLFGLHFPLQLEPFVYSMADSMCEEYQGGYWDFFALSNGGFYMAPHSGTPFKVGCENGFDGALSPDAFGIVCCLYAYSHLSFGDGQFALSCSEHYHLLREYMLDHPEAGQVLRAID
ncbi:antirestriction protein [Ferriphaselus sp. R-1]|uniref:antirestriction protein n=1 Tax=Ferriphaselus sp. R-1 TaxID=1485544 RepID=UPI00054CF3A7|nr:antirestriction protein [Ferriphaselus sp. R-1]